MAFNSFEFGIFALIVLGVYYCLGLRSQNLWLLAASYVFYGWWDWRFLSLILLSSVADFLIAHRITRSTVQRHRRAFLLLSLCLNLGLLATFKYFNFFVDSFITLGGHIGLDLDTPVLRLVPPVGISFYTFQTLSYTIDVYRRKLQPERNFLTFALFVAYFPQLVAGPIERASRLLPQLNHKRTVSTDCLRAGCVLILIGLFKKVVIADSAGVRVNEIFANASTHGSVTLFAGAVLFTLQIYGDFSGYSNIARGVSRLLGIQLVENFKTPYLARNISEFWRRWHISLSEWLRDYLYISLGGNRGSTMNTIRNLMVTMLLGGLWHGASWTFVIWGVLQGIYLVVHRVWRSLIRSVSSVGNSHALLRKPLVRLLLVVGSISLTYLVTTLAFVIFRADTFFDAWAYLSGMFELRGAITIRPLVLPALLIAMIMPLELMQYSHNDDLLSVRQFPVALRSACYAYLFISILLAAHQEIPFIYFQF